MSLYIKKAHKKFPKAKIMVNRGYEILSDIGGDIDYVLAEDLFTTYNFEKKEYKRQSEEDIEWQMNYINKVRQKFPSLVVFSLDFWEPEDKQMYQ